jgi:hypothetical protein
MKSPIYLSKALWLMITLRRDRIVEIESDLHFSDYRDKMKKRREELKEIETTLER